MLRVAAKDIYDGVHFLPGRPTTGRPSDHPRS
jgi:hypothetical protein